MSSSPDRPPRDQLSVARVRGLLSWLSHRGRLPTEALARVPELVAGAEQIEREWASDAWIDFPDGEGLWRRMDARCGCPTHDAHGFCEHRAAIVVLELWRRPDGRELFARPPWQLELDYLLSDRPRDGLDARAAPTPPRSDRACRLLIHVYSTGGYAQGFDFDVRLVRANKRGDGWLKPIKCPSDPDKLRAKAKPSEALMRAHDLIVQLGELRKVDAFSRQAPRLRSRVAHDLLATFEAAADELELRWEDLPITASTRAFRPTLRVRAGAPGRLEVRWVEGVIDHWRLEPSIVLTRTGVLCPLAADIPPALLDRVDNSIVSLDAAEFDDFARTILTRARVPIEVPDPVALGAAAVARREPRLYLDERQELLGITPKLAYVLADGCVVELPMTAPGQLTFDGQRAIVRDASWERARRDEFRDRVGRGNRVELIGEDAWTFLARTLVDLRDAGWAVFGEQELERNRVVCGVPSPRVRLGPSTDWFELEVDFIVEANTDTTLPAAAVIESWLSGQRFVELPDARIAALPERWLDRHGRALAELTALRHDAGRGLGAHALPLAAEILSEVDTDDPDQRARAEHWRARARELIAVDGVPPREAPPGLAATLRPYQARGYAWLCWLRDHGLGGCLADDMGLGKTIQALALLLDSHANTSAPASLIVCPTSVLHTWREQATGFAPSLRVHVHHGPRRGTPPADVDVIVTSYALLRHDADLFTSRRFHHLILDEAQALKNPDSQVARAARSLRVAHPVALTGTPLENHVVELWSLFEVLMPGFFGSRARFRKRWVDPIHKHEDAATLARLRQRMRPFLLRRLKREVASELPPKQTQVLRCRLGTSQRLLYDRVRATYRASVFGAVERRGIGGATLHILEALTRLRQACCHPALLPFPEARELATQATGAGVAKLELLRLLLDQAVADGHRSLVFSQWPSFLDHVSTMLDAAGLAHLRLDGSTRDRPAVLERWRDPAGPPVFLISTKAGGVGLDLTEADHVFHLDPWWNPASEDQASDRAHRIGQTRPVMVYKLVAADTVEDKILELQARKRALVRATVDTDRLEVGALRREDLEAVFAEPTNLDLDGDGDGEDLEADPRALAEYIPLPATGPSEGASAASDDSADVIELFPRSRG